MQQPLAAQQRLRGLVLVHVLAMARVFGRLFGTLEPTVPLRVETTGDLVEARMALVHEASQQLGVELSVPDAEREGRTERWRRHLPCL